MDWEPLILGALERTLRAPAPSQLIDSIRYSTLSPGKRFRPRLMKASSELLAVPSMHFIPFAVALEWIHAFTLIHDDLPCMDNDDFRRGIPTNHRIYGEAMALLAGDSLTPAAIELTLESLQSGCPQSSWLKALSQLLQDCGPRGVIGGQALELQLTPQSSMEELRLMHSLKTGALFDSAILIPAHLSAIAQGSADWTILQNFSRAFGLGFQTADDLEDAHAEWDDQKGFPHTSILSHFDFEKAREVAIHEVSNHLEQVRQRWPSTSTGLVTMTGDLIAKLKAASGSKTHGST